MEMKTCRFRTISDSDTRSTSCRGFSEFIFVADKLIFKISNRWKNNTHFYYFSTLYSISRPKIETKTCRFGTISDSATCSTSCRRFFKIHFRCGESPTLLPFKPLILTPPAKISDNWLLLQFFRKFFCVRVTDIIRKPNKKNASWNHSNYWDEGLGQVSYFCLE